MKNDEKINLVLSTELKTKIEEIAKKKNISKNSLIRMVLSEYVEKKEE